jgi:hypothetical protein
MKCVQCLHYEIKEARHLYEKVATIHLVKTREEYEEYLQKAMESGDVPHASIIMDESVFIPTAKLDVVGYISGQEVMLNDLHSTSEPSVEQTQTVNFDQSSHEADVTHAHCP